jgi:hypothetical protein
LHSSSGSRFGPGAKVAEWLVADAEVIVEVIADLEDRPERVGDLG